MLTKATVRGVRCVSKNYPVRDDVDLHRGPIGAFAGRKTPPLTPLTDVRPAAWQNLGIYRPQQLDW